MQTIAIIPARGGSKRIPRKNIRPFCGKPMIAWSIEAARKSGVFDAVIVSTDDDEVASVAESYGAEVPFRRPPELSNDHAATSPVIAHAIRWWRQNRGDVDYACCIYATAPFLKPEFLRKGLEILHNNQNIDFSVGITSYSFPIFRAIRITESGQAEMFWPENELKRSQDLPEAWHEAGQFDWGRANSWLDDAPFFSRNVVPVVIPRWQVQDIDTLEDLARAEAMFSAYIRLEQDENRFSV